MQETGKGIRAATRGVRIALFLALAAVEADPWSEDGS